MTTFRQINTGTLEFDCLEAGDPAGEAVIFLHGFPETHFMWRRLMAELASEGFYCIAPNMRGYSPNACPKGVAHYGIRHLRQDVADWADALGIDRFHLVGHDWGAAVGWQATFHFDQRILSWTALSVPHGRAFAKALKTDKVQRKKSSYIRWFLLPRIPEWMIRQDDFAKFRRLWKRSAPEEVENYLSVFRRKASLTAALNYYRANFGRRKMKPTGPVSVPTLFIWGNRDLAIGAFAARANANYVDGPYTFLEIDGGHWLIQENYPEVARAVRHHLLKYKTK